MYVSCIWQLSELRSAIRSIIPADRKESNCKATASVTLTLWVILYQPISSPHFVDLKFDKKLSLKNSFCGHEMEVRQTGKTE